MYNDEDSPLLGGSTTQHRSSKSVKWLRSNAIFLIIILLCCFIMYNRYEAIQKTHSTYQPTTCTFGATTERVYDDCAIVNCKGTECGNAPACGHNTESMTSLPQCCNGFKCLKQDYKDICTEPFQYNCQWTNNQWLCQTGYRDKKCNYACVQQVSNELCSRSCGKATELTTTYHYAVYNVLVEFKVMHNDSGIMSHIVIPSITFPSPMVMQAYQASAMELPEEIIVHPAPVVSEPFIHAPVSPTHIISVPHHNNVMVMTEKCAPGNTTCVDHWKIKHHEGAEKSCWYNQLRPDEAPIFHYEQPEDYFSIFVMVVMSGIILYIVIAHMIMDVKCNC